jgi:hypothetical protein
LGWALAVSKPAAAQSVIVTVPVGVSFDVRDVSAATAGSPATTPVTFTGANSFGKQDKLRISVKADTSAFSGPGSVHPAASKVSWTATASGGTASNGTLSATTYTQVFQSPGNVKPSDSGTANIAWTLASIVAPGLRSGTHTLSVRWKFEIF